MVSAIRLFFLKRSIKRCERYGLLVIEKSSAQGAFDTIDRMLHTLAASGHIQNGDGTGRRLQLVHKMERGSQQVAKLLRQGAGLVSYMKGEQPVGFASSNRALID